MNEDLSLNQENPEFNSNFLDTDPNIKINKEEGSDDGNYSLVKSQDRIIFNRLDLNNVTNFTNEEVQVNFIERSNFFYFNSFS